ncbi:MAG: hypothetical protein NVS4B2_16820 [Chloroflexota bacterium]
MLLRVPLAVALLIAGFQFSSTKSSTSASIGGDVRLVKSAAQTFDRGGLPALRAWAHRHPDAVAVRRGPDGRTLTLQFRDGIRGSLLSSRLSRVRVPIQRFRSHERFFAPGTARALIMEPFATQLGLGPNAADPERNALQNAGFAVDELFDQQVTLASMAAIHSYNLVYIETHSGVNTGGEGVVATGQLARDNDAGAASLLKSGAAILVHVSGSQQVYYGITSTYIRYYEDNFPGRSIVFLNGCETLNAPLFWQALQAKGVGVLVSWDKEATSMDNYLAGGAFFVEMSRGLSVKDAIAGEKSAGYGTSTVNGTPANLGFVGDGALTLKDAANPPTPTLTPTPATLPTSAPTPSRTSLPVPTTTNIGVGPPLTVSVLPYVQAGAKQIIHIASSPNSVIHVRITFPTGDTRSTTLGTDSSGVARFVFPQHSGRVVFNDDVAMVTVEAVRGSGATHAVARYRIGFAKFDLTVVPRTQAVDRVITIEAHAKPRSLVTAVMHFPSGIKQRLRGKTGAHGWVRLVYRVGHYLKRPDNHTVLVTARVRIGGKLYRAKSAFTIE